MSTLGDMLKEIPQDAEFHPEGNVWTHTRAVRRAMEQAIAMLPTLQIDDRERNILRLAAWCHDLGKLTATIFRDGRWTALGHDKAKHLNIALRRLSSNWRKMWLTSTPEDRKNFVYVCTRHMAVSDATGIDPRIIRSLRSNVPQQSRRAKLAVVLMVMDRLGTTRPSRVDDAMIVARAAFDGRDARHQSLKAITPRIPRSITSQ